MAKTARSRQSTSRPPASPRTPVSGKVAGKAQAVGSPISSAAEHNVSSSPTVDLSQAQEGVPEAKGNAPQAKRDTIQAKGEALQAKEGVPEAKGAAHQAKGEAFQAKEEREGAQHMASAQRPNAAGGDAKTEFHAVEQQSISSAHATPAQLPSGDSANATLLGADQRQEQSKAKTPIKPVRVVRYNHFLLQATWAFAQCPSLRGITLHKSDVLALHLHQAFASKGLFAFASVIFGKTVSKLELTCCS